MQLGKGGFGQLYLGRNIRENNLIAIKVEEEVQSAHFTMEFQIVRELKEEGIPKVYRQCNGHKHNSQESYKENKKDRGIPLELYFILLDYKINF